MSNTDQTAQIVSTIDALVSFMARRDYVAMERLTNGVRLTADDIKNALRPIQLEPSCLVGFSAHDVDIVEIRNALPRRWSVNVPLYVGSGTKTDLTMCLTLIEDRGPGERLSIELDDIHVL
jgi:thiamine monophosphate synthase